MEDAPGGARFEDLLNARGADTVIVAGGEADICVLGTMPGALDRGLRTIVTTDAVW